MKRFLLLLSILFFFSFCNEAQAQPTRPWVSAVHEIAFPWHFDPCAFVLCLKPICAADEYLVTLPGSCCPVCRPLCEPGSINDDCICPENCWVDGIEYAHGTSWISYNSKGAVGCRRKCHCDHGNIHCCRERREIRSLSQSEIDTLVNAMYNVKASGAWDSQDAKHLSNWGSAHSHSQFFPWHRKFLCEMEELLLAQDCNAVLPYWDWTLDSANIASSPVFDANKFGGDCSNVGNFDLSNWSDHIGNCISRSPGGSVATAATIAADMSLTPYHSFRTTTEFGVGRHGAVHCAVGGHMCSGHSPQDPLFYLHHCFIDKLWADWQSQSATNQNDYGPLPFQLTDIMAPFNIRVSDMMSLDSCNVCYEQKKKFKFLDFIDVKALNTIPAVRPEFQYHYDWINLGRTFDIQLSPDEELAVQATEEVELNRPYYDPNIGFSLDVALLYMQHLPNRELLQRMQEEAGQNGDRTTRRQ